VWLFAVVSQQYSAALVTSDASHVLGPAVIAAGLGCSSGCHDNASVSSVDSYGSVTAAAADVWGSVGHQSNMAAQAKPHDAWQSAGPGDLQQDLAQLFSQIGLGKYTDIFQQQEVS